MREAALWLALAFGLGCAVGPPAALPGRSALWGVVRLVPPDGAEAPRSGAYSDRRLQGVEWVDYSTPGFAVVFVEGDEADATPVEIAIDDGTIGATLTPAHAALVVGSRVTVVNRSAAAHTLSSPQVGFVRRLAPGERFAFEVTRSGPLDVHLLDRAEVTTQLFAVNGRFSVVSSGGRYVIQDLVPGSHDLHVWHPRFPSVTRSIEVTAGEAARLDLALGASVREEPADALR